MSSPADVPLLLPFPQKCRRTGSRFTLPVRGRVSLPACPDATVVPAGERLIGVLEQYGGCTYRLTAFEGSPSAHVRLMLDSRATRHRQGYVLRICRDGVTIKAVASAGLFYGSCTLVQLIRQFGRDLPCLRIEDWPDIEQRGVMLDISRDAVPTMETLFGLVDLLAGMKINHLQLYTEHTFAYEGHDVVWQGASPITPHEVLQLQQYCRIRHIQLVPNQNSFGHMERWLNHAPYEHLAECPGPPSRPGSRNRSLAPTRSGSIELMRSLYEQLLPHFDSPLFNIGCDETWQLGEGASRSACRRKGEGRVYLEYLLKLYRLARRHGKTPMIWADMVIHYPEILPALPPDLVLLVWGYEANEPFDRDCRWLGEQGVPFYVCPGTSSWLTLCGRTDTCVANLASAARAAVKHGAAGFLNCDWRDKGRSYLSASYLGYAYGAGVSWAYGSNRPVRLLPDKLGLHVFEDKRGKLGQTVYDLGRLDAMVCRNPFNHASLYVASEAHLDGSPFWDYEIALSGWEDYSIGGAEKVLALLKRQAAEITNARPSSADGQQVILELRQIVDQFAHACRKVVLARRLHAGKTPRGKLKSAIERHIRDVQKIKRRHRELWPARNRRGGLRDSLATFDRVVRDYRSVLKSL